MGENSVRFEKRRTFVAAAIGGALIAVLALAVSSLAQDSNSQPPDPVYVNGISQDELNNPEADLPPAEVQPFDKPHSIPAGFEPSPQLTAECERVVSEKSVAAGDPPLDPFMCDAILAFKRGELPPGEYTTAEIEDYLAGN